MRTADLFITVSLDGQPPRAVRITMGPAHRVGDLADALGQSFVVSSGAWLEASDGRALDPAAPIVDSGIVHGDNVHLRSCCDEVDERPPHRPVLRAGFALDVLTGPSAGQRIALPIGRSNIAELLPALATTSCSELDIDVSADACVVHPSTNAVVDGVTVAEPVVVGSGTVVRAGGTVLAVRELGPARFGATRERNELVVRRSFRQGAKREPVMVRHDAVAPSPVPARPAALLAASAPVAGGFGAWALTRRVEALVIGLASPALALVGGAVERVRARRAVAQRLRRFRSEVEAVAEELDEAICAQRRARFAAAPDVIGTALELVERRAAPWSAAVGPEDWVVRLGTGQVDSDVGATWSRPLDDVLADEMEHLLSPPSLLDDCPVQLDLAEVRDVAFVGAGACGMVASLLVQLAAAHPPEELRIEVVGRAELVSLAKWLPHADVAMSDPAAFLARRGAPATSGACTVVVVDDAVGIPEQDTAALCQRASRDGDVVVRLAAEAPHGVGAVVEVPTGEPGGDDGVTGTVAMLHGGTTTFAVESPPLELLCAAAQALAACRSVEAVDGALPLVVPLLDGAGFADAAERAQLAAEIGRRWAARPVGTLRTAIGRTASGLAEVDLVTDGPHGLIGGSSGSGKSELIVAMVAGLVSSYAPDQLNLLFVDYKGGAATEVFSAAPHTVGTVTNLDGRLAERALASLRAELDRRMRILAGRAKDLDALASLAPTECPARLVIVVDELATLVKEVPSFVDGLVDVAQRGRSLGIHLLLATQSPSRAIDDRVQANTGLRIALRMVDAAESTAVIGSRAALDIPAHARGRALVRTAGGGPVAVQPGFGGAPAVGRPAPLHIDAFDERLPGDASAMTMPAGAATQLDVLLAAVSDAAAALPACRRAVHRPWCDELPRSVALEALALPDGPRGGAMVLPIGLADRPEEQDQPVATVDLGAGGLLVSGPPRSGRSTALMTTIAAAPDAVVVAIGTGGGSLDGLGAAAVDGYDPEALTRALDAMRRELDRRRAAPGRRHRPLLFAIDGYEGVRDVLDGRTGTRRAADGEWLDVLRAIIVEGPAVGISPVVTVASPEVLPAAVLHACVHRLELGGSQHAVPGRGILGGTVVQVAQARRAQPPSTVLAGRRLAAREVGGAVAIADVTGEPIGPPSPGAFLVVGPPGSGRSTTLGTVSRAWRANGRDVVHLGTTWSGLDDGVALRSDPLDIERAIDEVLLLSEHWPERRAVVVDDLDRIPEGPGLIERWARLARARNVDVVASMDVRAATTGYFQNELVHRLRSARCALVLRPEDESVVRAVTGARAAFRPGLTFPAGRGVLVVDDVATVVQVCVTDSGAELPRGRAEVAA